MFTDLVNDPIAKFPKGSQQTMFRPLLSNAIYDLITLLPLLEEDLKHLGRILKISIDLHDSITARMHVIGEYGTLKTKVL